MNNRGQIGVQMKRMPYGRSNSQKLTSRIDVAAFASVMVLLMFTMLLIVMIQTSHVGHGGPQLPQVKNPMGASGANRDDALIIGISRDGKVFFGNDQIASDQLPRKIKDHLSRGSDSRIYIRADARAHYDAVKIVLGGVREAGIEKVVFLVDQGRGDVQTP